jgi:hypothetical protein
MIFTINSTYEFFLEKHKFKGVSMAPISMYGPHDHGDNNDHDHNCDIDQHKLQRQVIFWLLK